MCIGSNRYELFSKRKGRIVIGPDLQEVSGVEASSSWSFARRQGFDEVMNFLLCDFFSELLVLLFRDSFMMYALKEVLDIFKAVLAGVVGVEVGVEARDGCLGVKLSFVLGLGDAAIRILRLSDDLSDSVLPRRRTGEFVFDF